MHKRRGPGCRDGRLMNRFCGMPFTGASIRDVLGYLEARSIDDPFGYIVTPNVDHVVRNWREGGQLVQIYEDADLSLCDSRIVSLIGRLCRVRLPVVTGSDLTAIILEYLVDPYERVTVIGGADETIARLARRYGLRNVRHHNPPMGFVRDPLAVLEATQFVERNPARFVFLAVGSPQQEILAQSIRQRGQAHGIGLCVGASLLFLTGDLQRAPVWMQRARLEWLFRLAQEPSRMWRRYLYEGPKILRIAADHVAQRGKLPQRPEVSIVVPTFRHEERLPRLLERCGAQAGINPALVEIVVVDLAPEASARGVVERGGSKAKSPIRYLHAASTLDCRGLQRVLAQCAGEVVAFLADGDLPTESWLDSLIMAQRVYGADLVLGPVQPIFDPMPRRYVDSLRRFFGRTSDAATGTPVDLPRPFSRRRGEAAVPVALRNILLRRASCLTVSMPVGSPGTSVEGAADAYLQQLQRHGKRLVWCREAMVQQQVPQERLALGWLLRQAFRRGRITATTCLRVEPAAHGEFGLWLLTGLVRACGGILRCAMWPISPQRGFDGICSLANGLGMLSSLRDLRAVRHAAHVAEEQAA